MGRGRGLAITLVMVLVCSLLPARSEGAAAQRLDPGETGRGAAPTPGQVPYAARQKIEPLLMEQLLAAQQGAQAEPAGDDPQTGRPAPVTYLVYLHEHTPLGQDRGVSLATRQSGRGNLVRELQASAQRNQAGIVAYLEQRLQAGDIARYKSYWIFDGLAVDGNLETAVELALRPEVEMLRSNHVHHLPEPASLPAEPGPGAFWGTRVPFGQPEWGLVRIGADRVWQDYGLQGEGVVIANLDTGEDWTHPALQRQYRGYAQSPAAPVHDHNWYDPTNTYPREPGPTSTQVALSIYHGTHTLGTMVGATADGNNLIGVAPGAQWIAVKIFDNQAQPQSYDEWIHAAFQWCLAPTDLDGRNPDPSKAPDIINNSWGDDSCASPEVFRQDLDALRAAGILSTFSAGNAGPDASTIASPACLPNALAVGATDSGDGIWEASSRGPSPWEQLKPQVVAPGVTVRSAIPGGRYNWMSGTSMAAPHVAGLAALVLQADRLRYGATTLTITEIESVIMNTAMDLGISGADNAYGYGRIDAYHAVSAILSGSSIFLPLVLR